MVILESDVTQTAAVVITEEELSTQTQVVVTCEGPWPNYPDCNEKMNVRLTSTYTHNHTPHHTCSGYLGRGGGASNQESKGGEIMLDYHNLRLPPPYKEYPHFTGF